MTENKHAQALDVNDALNKSEAFVVKNKKALIGTVVAIILIIGGFLLYKHFVSGPREEKASTLLAKGQEYFATNNYEKALNGDGAGYIGFIKLMNEYSGTDAANLAKLYSGLTYAQMGKAQEAIKNLEEFSTSDDQLISPAAIAALGNCYAKVGQVDKAITTLKKAADKANNYSLSPIFLIQAGELLESQKKLDEAKACYQEIKDKYYQSELSQEIDKYIERVSK